MKGKIFNWILSILLVILISVFLILGTSIYKDIKEVKEYSDSAKVYEDTNDIEFKKKELSLDKNKDASYVNPFGDVHRPDAIDERTLRFYIYYMTNQKVDAPNDEGYYQISNERINFLLEVLDHKIYTFETTYRDILTRWKNNDYSLILEDHYEVLRLLNKKDGRATRLLTTQEEQALLENSTS